MNCFLFFLCFIVHSIDLFCLLLFAERHAACGGHNPPQKEKTNQFHSQYAKGGTPAKRKQSNPFFPFSKRRMELPLLFFAVPQPPISSSPTNPNQADASLCLCVQFLIGGLYCYNTFLFLFIDSAENEINKSNKKESFLSFVLVC